MSDRSETTADNPTLLMKTSEGDIQIELFADRAPISVENFLSYVRDGFFDGLIFHRVIPGFVIQGGGFDASMTQRATKPPIRNEDGNGVPNRRGTLSMARTNDPDSATSQFFINLVDNAALNPQSGRRGYAVFGEVTDGMDVVDRISAKPTANFGAGHQNVPTSPVTIKSVSIRD